MSASRWLRNEDNLCFEDRLSRLRWLVEHSPKKEYWTFPGGLLAESLFEEARYCFVYGQFLAANLLGLVYIERTLSALFYGAGRNDLESASLSKLLKEAHVANLVNSVQRLRTNSQKTECICSLSQAGTQRQSRNPINR